MPPYPSLRGAKHTAKALDVREIFPRIIFGFFTEVKKNSDQISIVLTINDLKHDNILMP